MAALTIFGKTIPLDIIWRHAKTIMVAVSITWGTIVYWGGDYFRAQADEAVVKMLERQGMAPQDFKKMQSQIESLDLGVNNLGTQIQSVGKRADELDKDVARMEDKVNAIDQSSRNTYDLLKALIPRIRVDASP